MRVDTASSLLKMKLNFGIECVRLTIAERIRTRKAREEDEKEANEKAFDEGLIRLGGMVALEVKNVVLISLEKGEDDSTGEGGQNRILGA